MRACVCVCGGGGGTIKVKLRRLNSEREPNCSGSKDRQLLVLVWQCGGKEREGEDEACQILSGR